MASRRSGSSVNSTASAAIVEISQNNYKRLGPADVGRILLKVYRTRYTWAFCVSLVTHYRCQPRFGKKARRLDNSGRFCDSIRCAATATQRVQAKLRLSSRSFACREYSKLTWKEPFACFVVDQTTSLQRPPQGQLAPWSSRSKMPDQVQAYL